MSLPSGGQADGQDQDLPGVEEETGICGIQWCNHSSRQMAVVGTLRGHSGDVTRIIEAMSSRSRLVPLSGLGLGRD